MHRRILVRLDRLTSQFEKCDDWRADFEQNH